MLCCPKCHCEDIAELSSGYYNCSCCGLIFGNEPIEDDILIKQFESRQNSDSDGDDCEQ